VLYIQLLKWVAPITTITQCSLFLIKTWGLIFSKSDKACFQAPYVKYVNFAAELVHSTRHAQYQLTLVRNRFQAKPAILLIPIDHFYRLFGEGALRYSVQTVSSLPYLMWGLEIHCLRSFSFFQASTCPIGGSIKGFRCKLNTPSLNHAGCVITTSGVFPLHFFEDTRPPDQLSATQVQHEGLCSTLQARILRYSPHHPFGSGWHHLQQSHARAFK